MNNMNQQNETLFMIKYPNILINSNLSVEDIGYENNIFGYCKSFT